MKPKIITHFVMIRKNRLSSAAQHSAHRTAGILRLFWSWFRALAVFGFQSLFFPAAGNTNRSAENETSLISRNKKIPSWQSHLLRFAQRGFRVFNGRFAGLDVAKERRNAAVAEKLFRRTSSVQYSAVTANQVPAEWIVPIGLSTERVVLYVHGGAFYSGSLAGARPVAAKVALAGKARVLTIDYRLTPEHPFPAALDDTQIAYEWLSAGGISPENIVLVGDSAGGTLVLALLVQLRDQGKPLPRGAVCLSPATDLTLSGDTWTLNARNDLLLDPDKIRAAIDLYLHGTDPRTPLASPLYADLQALPPLLILAGSDERLLSDATRLAAKAQAAGVAVTLEVWDRMQHGWHITADFLPEGRLAIARIGEFIEWGPTRPNATGQVFSA